MSKIQSCVTAALAALILVAAPNAKADVYTFDHVSDNGIGCASSTNCGTITVVQGANSNSVNITVALLPGTLRFLDTGGPHTPFAFNISGSPNVTISNLSTGWTVLSNGPFGDTPYGNFTYGLDCCGGQNGSSHDNTGLSFTVTYSGCAGGVNCLSPASFKVKNTTNPGFYFAADVSDGRDTGAIGASGAPVVPEPTSIAFFGTGLIGVVIVLRRKFSTK